MRLTYEGEHRCGKGTQIELSDVLVDDALVVRGDGSYQGGLEGIVSPEVIAFRNSLNKRLYSADSVSEKLWDVAATACAATISSDVVANRNLLIDRGPLSRASYLLSKGYVGRYLLDNMYPEFDYVDGDIHVVMPKIDVRDVDFGNIVYMQVPSAVLLTRITGDDPKAAFRRQNIIAKEGLFERAIDAVPQEVRDVITIVDGSQAPEDVLTQYVHLLK